MLLLLLLLVLLQCTATRCGERALSCWAWIGTVLILVPKCLPLTLTIPFDNHSPRSPPRLPTCLPLSQPNLDRITSKQSRGRRTTTPWWASTPTFIIAVHQPLDGFWDGSVIATHLRSTIRSTSILDPLTATRSQPCDCRYSSLSLPPSSSSLNHPLRPLPPPPHPPRQPTRPRRLRTILPATRHCKQ